MTAVAAETPRPCALYRMFDADDVLLYVGIAYSFGQRWAREAIEKSWWPEVKRQTVDWYPTREEAHRLEVEAIQAEKPKYNIAHAVKPPRPRKRRDHIEARETAEPDYERIVLMDAASLDDAGALPYTIDSPRIVAPGTYLITFDYDPVGHGCEPVRISQMVLVDAGDEVARRYGGTCEEVPEVNAQALVPLRMPCRCYQCRKAPRPQPEPKCTCPDWAEWRGLADRYAGMPMECPVHTPTG